MTIIIVPTLVFFGNVLKLLKSSLQIRANLQRKTNYSLISILSNIPKIYERLMHDNMSDYFN